MRALFDNFHLALGTFWANPLRSLLTLLGIVIGVATVVTMMGLIEGLRIKVTRDLSVLGANVFEISKRPAGVAYGGFDWPLYAKRPDVTLEDLKAILESCTSCSTASATQYKNGQTVASEHGQTRPTVQIMGSTSTWIETAGVTVGAGRFFGRLDELEARSVAVIGHDVVDSLLPYGEPVGQRIRVAGRVFEVIGVLVRRGSFLGQESMDNQVVIPLSTFQQIYGSEKYMEIDVKVEEGALFKWAQDEVVSILRRRRRLAPTAANNFEITTNESSTRTLNEMSGVITAAGIGVCFLSLVVGGIGVLNIMLVSVTERTREIGLRKALGARRRRILGQFATEAVVLALVGGLIGLLLGYGITGMARWVGDLPTQVPPWVVLLAVGMSSSVGLVFGIYPAAVAAALDPVEAMRAD
jgi:putative ABC transport system permease protein